MMNFLQNFSAHWTALLNVSNYGVWATITFFFLLIWSLVWKGMSLWRAARLGHKKWFIALLIINSFGVLEILYLFVFSKRIKNTEIAEEKTGL